MPPRTPEQRAERDRLIIQSIEAHWSEHGYAPSVQDLLDRLGLRSRASVQASLTRLQAAGIVDWDQGRARTLRVVDAR